MNWMRLGTSVTLAVPFGAVGFLKTQKNHSSASFGKAEEVVKNGISTLAVSV